MQDNELLACEMPMATEKRHKENAAHPRLPAGRGFRRLRPGTYANTPAHYEQAVRVPATLALYSRSFVSSTLAFSRSNKVVDAVGVQSFPEAQLEHLFETGICEGHSGKHR
jgi:hypothetical protein